MRALPRALLRSSGRENINIQMVSTSEIKVYRTRGPRFAANWALGHSMGVLGSTLRSRQGNDRASSARGCRRLGVGGCLSVETG